MAEQDSLEGRIKSSEPKDAQSQSKLEQTIEKEEKKTTFWGVVKDVLKFLPFAALNYYLAGPVSLIPTLSLAIGGWIADKKKGEKTTWKKTRRRMAIGNFMGVIAYFAYGIPDAINNATLAGKILKTLTFNPGMLIPFMGAYLPANYVMQKYGAKGFFSAKTPGYFKEAYDKALKGKYWKQIGELFLTLAPIHFFSMNYVTNVTARVGIGAFNDIVLALIAGEEGLLKTLYRKFSPTFQKIKGYFTPKSYVPAYPSYQPKPAYGGAY